MRPNGRIQVISYLVGFLLLFGVIAGCSSPAQGTVASAGDTKSIVLATTTSTQDSGLLDVILPVFEKQSGIQVKVVAVGTGQAIQLGKDGNADVLLVHARKDEDDFVASGYGVNAYDVMFNQFLLVGPKEDPAGVKGMTSATDAVKAIAAAKALSSRAGMIRGPIRRSCPFGKPQGSSPKARGIFSAGQGMGATLQMADEKNAYTLRTKRRTYPTKEVLSY